MASNDTRDIYIWVNYTLSGTPPSLSLNLNLKEFKKLIEDDLDLSFERLLLLKKEPISHDERTNSCIKLSSSK